MKAQLATYNTADKGFGFARRFLARFSFLGNIGNRHQSLTGKLSNVMQHFRKDLLTARQQDNEQK